MGNQVSGPNDAVQSDAASVRSVVRNPIRVLRKSSTNFFKRVDSKSPLSPIPTGTVPDVQQQDPARIYATAVDGVDEINGSTLLNETQESLCSPGPRLVKVASATSAKKASSQRPLSASSTLRAPKEGDNEYFRADSRSPVVEDALVSHSHPTPSPDALALRHAVLSPTIPAPSPLPEDSPHKYGLKDRLDSPDVLEPEDLNVIKARRRSSGVDIFNEAKSLESASSFLNGWSTSRRRMHSSRHTADRTYSAGRPSSAFLPSRATSTALPLDRNCGHNFKPSGFAYSRALSVIQIKCYHNHASLLTSRNHRAPVECSVCHIDDDKDYFSCSWCALRMCWVCRKDFGERGIEALKTRTRLAEMGMLSENDSPERIRQSWAF